MKNKQYSKLLKVVSVILSFAILMVSLPLSAIATQIVLPSEETQQTQFNDVGIVEMIDMRTESAKHFRLEDGSYVLAQYNSPVHYADGNGNWQDIDNRLFGFGSNITSGDARIKFASKTTGNGVLFTLHEGNHKLTLSLDGAAKKIYGEVYNYTSDIPESETELGKMTTLKNLRSSIRYADILPGVDLEYIINGTRIKENIIVKERDDTYSYSFTMSLNNLTATMLEDGSILIADPTSGEAVYQIPVPVMWDAAGVTSNAATTTLADNGNGKYTLTIVADSTWMNAADRAFPVTIDPPIYPVANTAGVGVEDFSISSADPNTCFNSGSELYVSAQYATYWKLPTLPELPNSAYITNATLGLTGCDKGDRISSYVGVYDVESDWEEPLTWTEMADGKGIAASNYTDFEHVYTVDIVGYGDYYIHQGVGYEWNITPLVKKWYAGSNYGLMLKPLPNTDVLGTAVFYSSEAIYVLRPELCIYYQDMKGLEDYWSFTSQSAGFAGTSAVNNATGKLIVSIPTLTTTDALMPFTPTLVYDSAIAGMAYTSSNTNSIYESPMLPNGFKMNLQECIGKQTYINLNGDERTRYVWADADGTEHYFTKQVGNTYADEDGLKLQLEDHGTTVTITDANKNVRTFSRCNITASQFDVVWTLSSIADKNGNMLSFDLGILGYPLAVIMTPNNSNPITQLYFYYMECQLAAVCNPTSQECVILRYSSDLTQLTQVVRAHGKNVESEWFDVYYGNEPDTIVIDAVADYTYQNGCLTQITNNLSGYRLEYTYDTACRVTSIRETAIASSGNVQGQELQFTYGTSTTEIRTSGTDDILGTSDDLLTKHVFDASGRTISTYTTDLTRSTLYGASAGQYMSSENENAKNNIKSSVQTVQHSSNYLLNGGFEIVELNSVWTQSGDVRSSRGYNGNESARTLWLDSSTTASSLQQDVILKDGDYYLSFCISSYAVLNGNVKVRVIALNGNTTVAERSVPVNEDFATGSPAFFGMPVKIESGVEGEKAYRVEISISGSVQKAESIQIDDVMLSHTSAATEYDMISAGHFETTNTSYAPWTQWKYTDAPDTQITVVESDLNAFGNVLKIGSNMGEDGVVEQVVYKLSEYRLEEYRTGYYSEWDPFFFTLSGWGKGTAQAHGWPSQFEIGVEITYYQGPDKIVDDELEIKIDFDRDTNDWQFGSVSFATDPKKGIVYEIKIKIAYTYHPGTAYFDRISLIQDNPNASAYEYNDDGYLTTYTSGRNSTWYLYDDQDRLVMSVSSQNRSIVEYTYRENSDLVEQESYKRYTGTYNPSTGEIVGSNLQPAMIYHLYTTYYEYNRYGQLTKTMVDGYNTQTNTVELHTESSASYNIVPSWHIFGTLESETDAMGRTTQYIYDPTNGRLLATIGPDETGVCYTYDAIGNLISVLPATYFAGDYTPTTNSASVGYTYDAANRLDTITTASTVYSFSYDVFGNSTGVSVGGNELVEYEYNPNNGKLNTLYYGGKDENGDARGLAVRYVYDALDRTSEIWYNTGENNAYEKVYSYEYNSFGSIFSVTDYQNNEVTLYDYDASGKLLQSYVYDLETYKNRYGVCLYYNDDSRISMELFCLDCETLSGVEWYRFYYSYWYDLGTGNLSNLEIHDDYINGKINFTYNKLNQLTQKVVDFTTTDGAFYQKINYTYEENNGAQGNLISDMSVEVRGSANSTVISSVEYHYEYDVNGNITKVYSGDVLVYQYAYDDLGQLIREDNYYLNKSYLYTYDNAGNMTLKKEYAFTTGTLGNTKNWYHRTYENTAWGDQLITYDGPMFWVDYDEIGNPTRYGYGPSWESDYMEVGYELTWNGRELVTFRKCSDFDFLSYTSEFTYTYNADGIRTSKTIDGVEHRYYLSGSKIMAEIWVEDDRQYMLIYLYDESGSPIGLTYQDDTYSHTLFERFFFEKNLQGDIVAVYNEFGEKIGSYYYDAWGNHTVVTESGNNSFEDEIVNNYNPFRYRGYYYDIETGFYYLQSRYYNPEWGRFLNPDGYINANGGLTGYNMYAYCSNNPVVRKDVTGKFWDVAFDVVSLIISVGDVIKDPSDPWNWASLAGDVIDVAIPCAGGVGEGIDAISKARKVANGLDAVHDTAKMIDNVGDTVSATKKGWKVGDDITNLTQAGTVPTWSTVRRRYWKNEAYYNPSAYSPEDIARMRKGLAPQVSLNGKSYSMELHHIEPKHLGGSNAYGNLMQVTPWDHAKIDTYRYFAP